MFCWLLIAFLYSFSEKCSSLSQLLWTLHQVNYLFLFFIKFFFPDVLSCSFIWNNFCVSFCLIFYACSYELYENVMSPGLEGLVLCRSIFCVDCVCQVTLAGKLKLEGVQAGWGDGPQDVPGWARANLAGWLELEQAWARAFPGCMVSLTLAEEKIKLFLYFITEEENNNNNNPVSQIEKKNWCLKRGNAPSSICLHKQCQ